MTTPAQDHDIEIECAPRHQADSSSPVRAATDPRWSHQLDGTQANGWRAGSVFVLDETSREIVYTGPDAIDVPDLVRELIEDLRADDQVPAMVKAAMAHLNLVMIHPFRDGNGRMARCLQTLVLAREGIVAAPFVSIEEYLGANTDAYYQVLADVGSGSWQPHRDARPWIRFVLTAHHRQAQTMIRRADEAERRWTVLTEEVTRRSLPERSLPALFNASMQFRLRNADYREASGVNDHVAGRDLRMLVDAGLLAAKGERRGRFYVATPRLLALNESIRVERRPIENPFDLPVGETPGL